MPTWPGVRSGGVAAVAVHEGDVATGGEPATDFLQGVTVRQNHKRPVPELEPAGELGGRYWDRTSDLLGVNEALSR